jgi:hypothetical protein
MKNNSRHKSGITVAALLFYLYFLLIGTFHFHNISIENFPVDNFSSNTDSHDPYGYENFCQLSHSLSSLFFNPGDNTVNIYFADNDSMVSHQNSLFILRIHSSKNLRAPPLEIS